MLAPTFILSFEALGPPLSSALTSLSASLRFVRFGTDFRETGFGMGLEDGFGTCLCTGISSRYELGGCICLCVIVLFVPEWGMAGGTGGGGGGTSGNSGSK